MKTIVTRKDFLAYGLNVVNSAEGKYIANDRSGFGVADLYFRSKREASAFWTSVKNDSARAVRAEGCWVLFDTVTDYDVWQNQK